MMVLLLTAGEAKAVRTASAHLVPDGMLDPRAVTDGTYAGSWVLPVAVLADPVFDGVDLGGFERAAIDPDAAWPSAD